MLTIRKESTENNFPFSAITEEQLAYKKGLRDIRLCARGTTAVRPGDLPVPAEAHRAYLYSVTGGPSSVVMVFWMVATTGVAWQRTFSVPADSGIVHVTSVEDPFSFGLFNTTDMYIGTESLLDSMQVEPCCTVWYTEQLYTLTLANEYRQHNPSQRANLNSTVLTVLDSDNVTLKLKDGYNCALTYDNASGTLNISAGAGRGIGLPTQAPWDSVVPDYLTGIKSINGVNNAGGITIKAGASLTPVAGESSFTLVIRKDWP